MYNMSPGRAGFSGAFPGVMDHIPSLPTCELFVPAPGRTKAQKLRRALEQSYICSDFL
jgi:hypothetical protein